MLAKTPDQKRRLAEHLTQHDPDTLAFLQASAKAFGPAESVTYGPRFEQVHMPHLATYGKRVVHWMRSHMGER